MRLMGYWSVNFLFIYSQKRFKNKNEFVIIFCVNDNKSKGDFRL